MISLHTLFPHEHHDELSSVEHEVQHLEADSLIDFIKLIFHEDMGEGHLEHVVVGHILSLDFQLDYNFQNVTYQQYAFLSTENRLNNTQVKEEFVLHDISPQRIYYQEPTHRGPPSNI